MRNAELKRRDMNSFTSDCEIPISEFYTRAYGYVRRTKTRTLALDGIQLEKS
jgi:hypothetical protein